MVSNADIFLNNHEYIAEYLKWIDTRIKSIYDLKNNIQADKNPLKSLVVSNEDVNNIINNSSSYYDNQVEYNILNDELFIHLDEKTKRSLDYNIQLNLEKLCSIFNLNKAEKIFLLLSLAVEINPKYERIYAFFNNNINKTRPTINFALDVFGINNFGREKMRQSFFDEAMFKSYILHYTFGRDDYPLFSNEIKLDDRIINYLLGINRVDNDIREAIIVVDSNVKVNINEEKSIYTELVKLIKVNAANSIYICIYGESGIGKKENIKLLCKRENRKAIIANLKLFTNNPDDFKINIRKTIREAIIEDAMLVYDNYDEITHIEDSRLRSTICSIFVDENKKHRSNVFILSTEKIKDIQYFDCKLIDIEVKKPTYKDRVDIWNHFLNSNNLVIDNVNDYAAKFNFTPKQIEATVSSYKTKLILKDDEADNERFIYESCFEQVSHNLYKRASKVNLNYSWDQLVLPKDQKSLLLDACNQVENKYKVYEEWGFEKTVAYGKGVTIVCSGPPGTGKTMSAQVLANKLNLELFKIDLSQIVSKYVGETEKNLNEIFNEAKVSNAVLFFDEADALFGKRSEVKSSNDRYANLETSYLLQKIEEYEGVSILATNYLKNIDDAFIRRMKYIISFPFPDMETRREIWKITIPDKAPTSQDIDFDFLAETFEISGGNIKNILVYAAFLAAAENHKINMQYILKATKYEMQKIGKLVLGQDLKQYRHLVE